MLNVQIYLKENSLTKLKEQLGIEINEYDNLVILNYSQIDSPKLHPVVMECRGLVLEKDSWDAVCYPLKRFFNYEEISDSFDFSKAIGLQKLDGSLISVFNYKDKWLFATRGKIENECHLNQFTMTFKELFDLTIKQYPNFLANIDKQYTYCFELTAPENRVVTVYSDRQLHLLMMRNAKTLDELSFSDLQIESEKIGIKLPNIVTFSNKDDLMTLTKKLATLEEGFVAVDYSRYNDFCYERVKVKNPSYVAIAHLKDNSGRSNRSLLSLVYDGDVDEFISYFPEFKEIIDKIKCSYDKYVSDMKDDVEKYKDYFKCDRKTFAMVVKDCANSSYLFQLYYKKVTSVHDFFNQIEQNKTRKYLEKYLVEKLKIKDIELISKE
jgi:T4 RnlA family RNA ligase